MAVRALAIAACAAAVPWVVPGAAADQAPPADPHVARAADGLALTRATRPGAFLDVAGRRAAWLGYEHGGLEAWVYPLKILEDFSLGFTIDGYPLEIRGRDIAATIAVRPDATTIAYRHAAFTVRQTLIAPIDTPGLVMLLDVDTTLPLTISASFRPRLRLMWPAGLMTQNVGFAAASGTYALTEETGRFAAVIGAPGARDVSLMPYQEEPRDVPLRFVIDTRGRAGREPIPIVIAASVEGPAAATGAYRDILASIPALHAATRNHYARLLDQGVRVTTPDAALNTAYAWARVGIDKGLATNPWLGTGLIAGFRTSGDSERPGFAWYFGRDALWTALATTAAGDFETTRTALALLGRFQREDGRIPHEISQSATEVSWFTAYPYAWASADATPLFVIAHADYWRASGDDAWLATHWPLIRRAWTSARGTDADGNGLIDNTGVGHAWVEGGALYPAHEEIYLQGLWIRAQRDLADLAEARGEPAVAAEARAGAERTRQVLETTYWLEDRGHYAFATQRPLAAPKAAEPGPGRERRQHRLDALAGATLVDEDTVLPAVPLWWRLLDPARADRQIDALGAGAIATDWGARLLSRRSDLYDPLSYHYGSVWPLFTGWVAMGAYAYGRPHVGYQALMATAHLTWDDALGYVTELLSGDFNTAFGRSSHHQIWSEAMVVAPLLRGLLGLDVGAGGRHLTLVPHLPADWDRVSLAGLPTAGASTDVEVTRGPGQAIVSLERSADPATPLRVTAGLALPQDAVVRAVTVDGRRVTPSVVRRGDVQVVSATFEATARRARIVLQFTEGTDVIVAHAPPAPGARSEGLRVLRARATPDALRLVVEGRPGREYSLVVRTPARLGTVEGLRAEAVAPARTRLTFRIEGTGEDHARREFVVPLRRQ